MFSQYGLLDFIIAKRFSRNFLIRFYGVSIQDITNHQFDEAFLHTYKLVYHGLINVKLVWKEKVEMWLNSLKTILLILRFPLDKTS